MSFGGEVLVGEVLAVQRFINEMTGQDIKEAVVRAALERAAEYRQRWDQAQREAAIHR